MTQRLRDIRSKAPYPDYPPAIYRAVFAAISRAWQMLVAGDGETAFAAEVETTACLHELLEIIRCSSESTIPDFTSRLFETVQRDASLPSYDGRHLEKRPDLAIRLIDREPGFHDPIHRAIFVECKLVKGTSKSLLAYGDEGIVRFVKGQYAWAMPTGVMVAYATDGRTVEKDLSPLLEKYSQIEGPRFLTISMPKLWSLQDSRAEVYSSLHGRHHSRDGKPGNIRLHHLWLK